MEYKVGVISGDGIGPEIVTEAKKVLDKIADKYGHSFNYTDAHYEHIGVTDVVDCILKRFLI